MLIRNSFAHLVGRITSLAAGLVLIPLVTVTLGTEALGLLGAYATLLAIFGLFDLGLPTAVNRELAILIGRGASPHAQAALIRSIEVIFWGCAVLFCVIGWLVSDYLVATWFKIESLPGPVVVQVILLIVAAAAIRFPVAFYSNVLFALDRHSFPNLTVVILSIVRTIISAIALIKYQIGLEGFFVIQLLANAAEVMLLLLGVWTINRHWNIRLTFDPLRRLVKQIGILTAVALTAVALSQIDKIILSKILTLAEFGIYSAAYSLASGLAALSYPIVNAIFPELSRRIDQHDNKALTRLIRSATELTILVIVPLGAVMTTQPTATLDFLFLVKPFPSELVAVMSAMMLGGAAQAFVTLPHLYQVAASHPGRVLWINGLFFLPYAALVFLAATTWGVLGAAVTFTVFNIARLLVHWGVLLTNPDSTSHWRSVPFLAVAINAVCLGAAWIAGVMAETKNEKMLAAALTVAALTTIVAMILPASRRNILSRFA